MKKLFFLFFILCFSGCANPTVAIQSELKQFKELHSNQIQTFQGKNQIMGYAWSGDPNKPPILFVHGSPGSWEGWVHFLMDPDLQKNFHLIAIDRPGYGQSNPGVTVTSLVLQASDVIEVLKINTSHKPAILVGHSYGGPVIAKIAMDFPKQVAGLVFVASSVSPELEHTKWYQYPASWWPVKYLLPNSLRVCNEEIMPLKPELVAMLPDWKNINAKSALIQGEDDDLVPPANLDFLIQQLNPKDVVKITRLPKVNHFIPWQHPETIFDAIHEVNNALEH